MFSSNLIFKWILHQFFYTHRFHDFHWIRYGTASVYSMAHGRPGTKLDADIKDSLAKKVAEQMFRSITILNHVVVQAHSRQSSVGLRICESTILYKSFRLERRCCNATSLVIKSVSWAPYAVAHIRRVEASKRNQIISKSLSCVAILHFSRFHVRLQ